MPAKPISEEDHLARVMQPVEEFVAEAWHDRFFVLLCSLFTRRPVFDHELESSSQSAEEYLQSASSAQGQSVIAKERALMRSINKLSRRLRQHRWLFRITAYLFMARALYYLFVITFQYKVFLKGQRLKIERREGAPTVYSYGCLSSDCSRLLDPELNQTVSQQTIETLPIFSLCHPNLSPYYEPITNHFLAGPIVSITGFTYALMIDLLIFILHSKGDQDDSLLLFLVAPRLAYKTMLDKAKQCMSEVRFSYKHFLEAERVRRIFELVNACRRNQKLPPNIKCDSEGILSVIQRHHRIGVGMLKMDQVDQGDSVQDCLPLIRSRWWFDNLALTIKVLSLLSIANVFMLALGALFVNHYFAVRTNAAMRNLQAEVTRANCSFWRAQEAGPGESASAARQAISLDGPTFGLNWYIVFTVAVNTLGWPFFWGVAVFINLVMSVWEVRCWACELRYKLIILQPLVNEAFKWPSPGGEERPEEKHRAGELSLAFDFHKYRLKFIKEVRPIVLTLWSRSSFVALSKKVENRMALEENYYQQPVGAWLPDDPELVIAKLLEKIYVEVRLMQEMREGVQKKLSLIVVGCIISNYFTAAMAVAIIRMLQEIRFEAVFIAVFGQGVPILLIANSVSMSSQLTRLSPLIKNILADLSRATNGQLRHLRSLMWRLVDDLESVESVAPSIHHIRFTYVNMIQIILTVITMFLFVLKT